MADKLGSVHHYVPQGYLRRFSVGDNRNKIYAYEVNKEAYLTNVHNVAGERDFYTFKDERTGDQDAELEDALAKVDDVGIDLMRKLDDAELGPVNMSDKDRGSILSYIAFQHTRNPQEMRSHAQMYDVMAQNLLELEANNKEYWHEFTKRAQGDKYDHKKAEKARQAVANREVELRSDSNDQYFLGSAMTMSKTLYKILFLQKRMIIVEALPETSGFVTSDNPVTHYLLEEQKKWPFPFNGLGYLNAVFQFPISPKRCLLMINDDMSHPNIYQYNQDEVDRINYYTYFYAERWIFSNINSSKFKTEFAKANNKKPMWKMA